MARTSHHALVTFHEPRSAFEDPAFDFETRILLGAVSQGIGDAGLVLAIVEHIHDGDAASWFNAWKAAAASLAERGAAALQAGHPRRAQWAYLTASEYYAKALVAVDGLPDDSVLTPTFAAQQLMWEAYVDASDGRFVPLDVPYEDTTLPGYLLRPDTSGRVRPTLVLTNGSDGSLAGLVGYAAAEAPAQDWNAFLYDGPGRQSMLFLRGVPFRPDWEAVLTLAAQVGRVRDKCP